MSPKYKQSALSASYQSVSELGLPGCGFVDGKQAGRGERDALRGWHGGGYGTGVAMAGMAKRGMFSPPL